MMGRQRPAEDREVVARYRPIEEIIPGHWVQGAVEANGLRHHYYRTGGEKPALVLLHGLQESGLTWLRVAGALERDYDLVMPDARGHGRSDRAGGGFSEEALRDDAAALIRALGLARPAVLGHSMGASTAALVGATYPELIRAVLLEDPVWAERPGAEFVNSPGYQAWLSGWLGWLRGLREQSHEERLIAALMQLTPGSPLPPEDEYVAWVDASAHLDLDLFGDIQALWSQPSTPVRDLVPQIAGPVLVMRAAQSFPLFGPPAQVREELSSSPQATIVRFEGTGHLIHREQPDAFLRVVTAFLNGERVA